MTAIPRVVLNTGLNEGMCFGCGKQNPIGLKLSFTRDGDTLRTEFTPGTIHQGWPGLVHGGILACLLDEVMSNIAYAEGVACLTASMEMRLRQPVRVAVPLVITAVITRKNRKLIETKGRVCLKDGTVVAESAAKQFIADNQAALNNQIEESRSHV